MLSKHWGTNKSSRVYVGSKHGNTQVSSERACQGARSSVATLGVRGAALNVHCFHILGWTEGAAGGYDGTEHSSPAFRIGALIARLLPPYCFVREGALCQHCFSRIIQSSKLEETSEII